MHQNTAQPVYLCPKVCFLESQYHLILLCFGFYGPPSLFYLPEAKPNRWANQEPRENYLTAQKAETLRLPHVQPELYHLPRINSEQLHAETAF